MSPLLYPLVLLLLILILGSLFSKKNSARHLSLLIFLELEELTHHLLQVVGVSYSLILILRVRNSDFSQSF